MSVFADCQDERNKKTIVEIDCPECREEEALEVFLKDGMTVGESACGVCGYVIPEGVNLEKFLEDENRNPVSAGGFHADLRAVMAKEPIFKGFEARIESGKLFLDIKK